MSSCRTSKPTRTLLGLATLATVQTPILARSASSNFRYHIPVRSQNNSSSTVPPQAQSSILSRPQRPFPTTVSVSMPKKTEDSILKHVERLRKTRAAQATYKTTSAFAKAKPAVSRPAQSRPASRPASRVPSTSSSTSSSSAARIERSVDAHIERITKAREKRSPTSSSRPSPATSRKVSPVQPLRIAKKSSAVDLAQIDDKLAHLSVAPLVVKTKPMVPALRSCLKTVASTSALKSVRFLPYGGWNIHGLKAFQPDSPPNTFLSLDQANLLQPTHRGRQKGLVYGGNYQLVLPNQEIRWPPPEHDGPIVEGSKSILPTVCRSCARAAARGSTSIRYRPVQVSVWCHDCMSDPARRPYFTPALDDNGEDDDLDTCQGPHYHTPDTCQYLRCAYKANVRWLYANYPERYEACDNILND